MFGSGHITCLKKIEFESFLVTHLLLPLIALNPLLSHCLVTGSFYLCDSQISFNYIALLSFNLSSERKFTLPPNLFFFFPLLKTMLLQPSLSIYSVIYLVWLFRSEIAELRSIAHFIFHRHCKWQKSTCLYFQKKCMNQVSLHSSLMGCINSYEIFSIQQGKKIIMVF